MAFFLVRSPVLGRDGLELREKLERPVEVTLVSGANGAHVERIRVARIRLQYTRKVGQCVVELFCDDLVLDGPQVRNQSFCFHAAVPSKAMAPREGGAMSC